jgi:hypothetical protein
MWLMAFTAGVSAKRLEGFGKKNLFGNFVLRSPWRCRD